MIPVLVISDDYWHPAEVIERGFRSLPQNEYSFDFTSNPKDILTPEFIKNFPLIVNCKSNRMNSSNESTWFSDITEVGVEEFDAYVREGGGFLSLHAANTAKDRNSGYGKFIGNVFTGHPPRCTIDVNITGSHPIVEGIKDFTLRDEHYQIECFAEDAEELFIWTSNTPAGTQVGGYVMERGKGRICVMTPGHILSVWTHPSYQKIVLNALKWCMRK